MGSRGGGRGVWAHGQGGSLPEALMEACGQRSIASSWSFGPYSGSSPVRCWGLEVTKTSPVLLCS